MKRKLQAINSNTIYDVTAKMRRMTRDVERGEFGEVTDAMVMLRSRDGRIRGFHFGTASVTEAYRMACAAKKRLEGDVEREVSDGA